MKTVWKYELEITDFQVREMPVGAEMLHVADQYGKLALWARVDPDAPKASRAIFIRGTGHGEIADFWPYVGTVVSSDTLVWHVFDGLEEWPQ